MRLSLGEANPSSNTLPDKWIEYTTSSIFSIAGYLSAGYDTIDIYCVGAGGGGGSGGGCTTTVANSAGGGGGGGGSACLAYIQGVILTTLPGSNTITIAAAGVGAPAPAAGPNQGHTGGAAGDTFFGTLIQAWGGGSGAGGFPGGSVSIPGNGAGGGGGASQLFRGDTAVTGTSSGADASPYGDGGIRASRIGHVGYNATGVTEFAGNLFISSGAGGGGGGHGWSGTTNPTGVNLPAGGSGGSGILVPGSPPLPGYGIIGKPYGFSGAGGGGGGGVNLAALTGHPVGNTAYGRGGQGGYGAIYGPGHTVGHVGSAGVQGVCLVRVYKAAA